MVKTRFATYFPNKGASDRLKEVLTHLNPPNPTSPSLPHLPHRLFLSRTHTPPTFPTKVGPPPFLICPSFPVTYGINILVSYSLSLPPSNSRYHTSCVLVVLAYPCSRYRPVGPSQGNDPPFPSPTLTVLEPSQLSTYLHIYLLIYLFIYPTRPYSCTHVIGIDRSDPRKEMIRSGRVVSPLNSTKTRARSPLHAQNNNNQQVNPWPYE